MNYFYVYQNKTYYAERQGGFLWSPQYASGGRSNPGYEAMKQVKPGDIIFHSYYGEILAISKAQSACYSCMRPGGFEEWDRQGWRIDTVYFVLPRPLKTEPIIPELYKIQPMNGPFTSAYRGKQQYLCNANQAMFNILMEKIIGLQSPAARQALFDFVGQEVTTGSGPKPGPGPDPIPLAKTLSEVVDGCTLDVFILEKGKESKIFVSVSERPKQKTLLGKKVGDTFTLPNIPLTYRIDKIYQEIRII